MSGPTIPDFPPITVTREDSVVLLFASIAREEMALSHLVNGEAEKLRFVSGALERGELTAFNDLLLVQQSVRRVMDAIVLKELQLQLKLGQVKEFLPSPGSATEVST